MQIELRDGSGYSYRITSSDAHIIGAWFAEMAPIICSADTRYNHPVQVDVWPMTDAERSVFVNGSTFQNRQGKAAWLDLIDYLGKLADAIPVELPA